MLDTIRNLTEIPCVNGSERQFALNLKELLTDKGLTVKVFPGNHVFFHKSNANPDTIVFTPMDSPGFTCLYKEDGIAYLTSTSKSYEKTKDFEVVINSKGIAFKTEASKYDQKAFCIKDPNILIGETFSAPAKVHYANEIFSGRFCSKFACIAILMRLMDELQNRKIGCCITAGFYSGSSAESNVMKRVGAKNAILLNSANFEEETNKPMIAIKDGKHFSSKILSDAFAAVCCENKISIQNVIFDEAISSADRIYAPEVKEILSLALPCRHRYTENETTRGTSLMLQALISFLNCLPH